LNEFRGWTPEFIPTHSGKSVRSKWPGAEGFGRIAVDENNPLTVDASEIR